MLHTQTGTPYYARYKNNKVQKSGRINLMIQKVTFGLLVVLFMKWLLFTHLLEQKIWMGFIKKLLKEFIQNYHQSIQINYHI